MSADVAQGDRLWDLLVDRHLDAVWQIVTAAGLSAVEAATVAQLTWLRLAERWPMVSQLARDRNDSEHPLDQPAAQLDEWILHTTRTETDAWLEHQHRLRQAGVGSPTVVRLGPGFGSGADGGLG